MCPSCTAKSAKLLISNFQMWPFFKTICRCQLMKFFLFPSTLFGEQIKWNGPFANNRKNKKKAWVSNKSIQQMPSMLFIMCFLWWKATLFQITMAIWPTNIWSNVVCTMRRWIVVRSKTRMRLMLNHRNVTAMKNDCPSQHGTCLKNLNGTLVLHR